MNQTEVVVEKVAAKQKGSQRVEKEVTQPKNVSDVVVEKVLAEQKVNQLVEKDVTQSKNQTEVVVEKVAPKTKKKVAKSNVTHPKKLMKKENKEKKDN